MEWMAELVSGMGAVLEAAGEGSIESRTQQGPFIREQGR